MTPAAPGTMAARVLFASAASSSEWWESLPGTTGAGSCLWADSSSFSWRSSAPSRPSARGASRAARRGGRTRATVRVPAGRKRTVTARPRPADSVLPLRPRLHLLHSRKRGTPRTRSTAATTAARRLMPRRSGGSANLDTLQNKLWAWEVWNSGASSETAPMRSTPPETYAPLRALHAAAEWALPVLVAAGRSSPTSPKLLCPEQPPTSFHAHCR